MKLAIAAVLLFVGCHKGNNVAGGGSAGGSAQVGSAVAPGSAGSAVVAAGSAGSAGTTSAGSASPALVAAVADVDHDLAPAMKLDVHPRIVALAKLQPGLLTKVQTLASAGPPAGVEAGAWNDAVGELKSSVDGIGMCTQDLAKYDGMSKAAKDAADDGYEECMKPLPDAFAAVVKLVPGAKASGSAP